METSECKINTHSYPLQLYAYILSGNSSANQWADMCNVPGGNWLVQTGSPAVAAFRISRTPVARWMQRSQACASAPKEEPKGRLRKKVVLHHTMNALPQRLLADYFSTCGSPAHGRQSPAAGMGTTSLQP